MGSFPFLYYSPICPYSKRLFEILSYNPYLAKTITCINVSEVKVNSIDSVPLIVLKEDVPFMKGLYCFIWIIEKCKQQFSEGNLSKFSYEKILSIFKNLENIKNKNIKLEAMNYRNSVEQHFHHQKDKIITPIHDEKFINRNRNDFLDDDDYTEDYNKYIDKYVNEFSESDDEKIIIPENLNDSVKKHPFFKLNRKNSQEKNKIKYS